MRIKRTTNDTQTCLSKKHLFKIIDESTDEEKKDAEDDSVVFDNSFDSKSIKAVQEDDKLIDHSNDHVYHMDDFSDDYHLLDQQHTFMSKDKKFALIDEESDADIDNNKNTTDDGVWDNKYIDDAAEETLQGTDMSDKDDKDSFIDDESLGYYTTDDEDNDDDF